MSWSSRIVDELAELKQTGAPFQVAWRIALEHHPPMDSAHGLREPTLFNPESGGWEPDQEESLVAFMRRVCDDAWHGRRPELEHLHALLDRLDAFDDSFAVAVGTRGRTRSVV